MKVLILGGDGLVGSTFDYGKRVNRKDANLTDYTQTYELIKQENPDWVINCAGKVGGVQANINYKFDFFEKNILINLNVIKACMDNNVHNLISFMSTCIFPDKLAQNHVLDESMLHLGEPHQSNYPYAYAKRMIDVMSKIGRERGFNFCSLIPTNLYGVNDNFDLETSHLIPALIRKVATSILNDVVINKSNSTTFEVWGTGRPMREFLFAEDIPKICRYIIDNEVEFDNMIISDSSSIKISKVVSLIIECFNEILSIEVDITPIYDNSKPDGQILKMTDTSKFSKLVPIELTPLKVGLKKVIKSYLYDMSEFYQPFKKEILNLIRE